VLSFNMRLPPRNPRNHSHQQRVLPRCFTEVMLRIANPARQLAPSLFVNGEKGERLAGASLAP
jgi:hypothetical protein